MTLTEGLPVLAIGAGPTGLTAALELSRLGVPVRIVDRAPAPSTTSRALGVQARTIELLRPRGVADELTPGPAWLLVRPDGYLAAAGTPVTRIG